MSENTEKVAILYPFVISNEMKKLKATYKFFARLRITIKMVSNRNLNRLLIPLSFVYNANIEIRFIALYHFTVNFSPFT